MNLEEFYESDPRRRHSEEFEFGREWNDGRGRCEVSWVKDTGELYVMAEPGAKIVAVDGIGDSKVLPTPIEGLQIEVIGIVDGLAAIEAVMSGWEDAMAGDNSLQWVRDRAANAANELNDPPAKPSDDMPTY